MYDRCTVNIVREDHNTCVIMDILSGERK